MSENAARWSVWSLPLGASRWTLLQSGATEEAAKRVADQRQAMLERVGLIGAYVALPDGRKP